MKYTTHWAGALLLWCLSSTAVCAAPSSEEAQLCVAASTQGQTDRDEGRLLAAREQLLSCARELCPAIVRKSCAHWLSELAGRIPSVVVRVEDAEQHDVTDAQVLLDGHNVTLDGRPLSLDPGRHVLVVDAHAEPIERTFLIAEREQGRLIVVELPAPPSSVAPAEPAPPPVAAAAQPPPAAIVQSVTPAAASFRVPTMGWVLGGVGVLGIGTFTVLRIQVANDLRALDRNCSPGCSDHQRDVEKRKALIADISLGVGIAALAAGVAWTLFAQPDDAPSVAFSVVPTSGGALATLAARY